VRATLVYNPAAGRRSQERLRQLARLRSLLGQHGFDAETVATTAAGSAAAQVRAALAAGSTYIFACGGDGTLHDVLQGMAGTALPGGDRPVLAIVPMGSANALARHLHLSMDPVEALRQQMGFAPRLIPAGRVEWESGSRFFLVMAGAGPDGMLVYRMLGADKERLGRLAYYTRAAYLFATRRFPAFEVEYTAYATGERDAVRAVSAMAVRVGDLGGLFAGLAGAGEVMHPHLNLVAVRPPAWLGLPLWFASSRLGLRRWNPRVLSVEVQEFRCAAPPRRRVYLQADGEWLGSTPMRVSLVPDAVQLLMPPSVPTA
jgi:diacylglycerol kinase family enzyme